MKILLFISSINFSLNEIISNNKPIIIIGNIDIIDQLKLIILSLYKSISISVTTS